MSIVFLVLRVGPGRNKCRKVGVIILRLLLSLWDHFARLCFGCFGVWNPAHLEALVGKNMK
jgi:hypothetical protein